MPGQGRRSRGGSTGRRGSRASRSTPAATTTNTRPGRSNRPTSSLQQQRLLSFPQSSSSVAAAAAAGTTTTTSTTSSLLANSFAPAASSIMFGRGWPGLLGDEEAAIAASLGYILPPGSALQLGSEVGPRPPVSVSFSEQLRCFSLAMAPGGHRDANILFGGKLILPPSALAKLARYADDEGLAGGAGLFMFRVAAMGGSTTSGKARTLPAYQPLVTQITDDDDQEGWSVNLAKRPEEKPQESLLAGVDPPTATHMGVLEFVAEEGRVYAPHWMMAMLGLDEGSLVRVTSVPSPASPSPIPKGKLVKLQAQSPDFVNIVDAKAALESALKYYVVLTRRDVIEVSFGGETFSFAVVQVEPDASSRAICILNTDLEVDFATPVGYVDPSFAEARKKEAKTKQDLENVKRGTLEHHIGDAIQKLQLAAADKWSHLGPSHSLKTKSIVQPDKGKQAAVDAEAVSSRFKVVPDVKHPHSPPALILSPGSLFFGFPVIPVTTSATKIMTKPMFAGQGRKLTSHPTPTTQNSQNGGSLQSLPWVAAWEKDVIKSPVFYRPSTSSSSHSPESPARLSLPLRSSTISGTPMERIDLTSIATPITGAKTERHVSPSTHLRELAASASHTASPPSSSASVRQFRQRLVASAAAAEASSSPVAPSSESVRSTSGRSKRLLVISDDEDEPDSDIELVQQRVRSRQGDSENTTPPQRPTESRHKGKRRKQ